MSSLTVYYDGTNFVPLEKVNLEPNQKLTIEINKQNLAHPLDINKLTKKEFDSEIQKGLDCITTGETLSSKEVRRYFAKKYQI